MSEDGCLPIIVIALFCALTIWFAWDLSSARAHHQFVQCRTLLATRDSATVIDTKPECARWTLPAKEGK